MEGEWLSEWVSKYWDFTLLAAKAIFPLKTDSPIPFYKTYTHLVSLTHRKGWQGPI